MSDTPVTFPPGFCKSFTKPALTGSVTAEKTIGISLVALAAAWDVGVAIVTITSTLSEMNL